MKLLIVEENLGLRRLLRVLLSTGGGEIYECVEGTEAVSLCALERPGWVVLDLNLARADGLSITRQLRRTCPQAAHQRIAALLTVSTPPPNSAPR